ncbi:nitroreductase/quinone reductase family protein [Microbispora sp. NPDC046973]|uniref:nitroreductase/quinone reductase family protein n=1 Tax=Microbispora sp. NPDC046973 TaxID=3155022 RepID=UPI0033E36212
MTYNERVIEEFRGNGGVVADFAGIPLLLLTTTGARTGRSRTTPLVYLPDGDRLVVFAANGGADRSPAWYHNLMRAGTAVVEVPGRRYRVHPALVGPPERDDLWRRQIERVPQFAEFRAATTRDIPVIALEPADD